MTTGETELIHFIQNIIIFIQFKNKALFLDRDGVINNKEDNKKCKYRIKKLNLFFLQ
jgi:histidinol phosphatase-like enzyme